MRVIKIEVTPDSINIDAIGFKGKVCEKQIDNIISNLKNCGIDLEIKNKDKKREYYVQTATATNNIVSK